MKPQPILFSASNQHHDRIVELHMTGLQETGSYSLDPALDRDLIDVEKEYASGLFLLAALPGDPETIIGMGALKEVEYGVYEIKRMRIHADARRMGVGQAILFRLIEHARTLGIRTLRLDTSLKQVAAQKLYEKNGFEFVREVCIGGISSKIYELNLEP